MNISTQKGSTAVVILVVIIVILAGALVGYYFINKSGNVAISTTDWKTYNSDPLGFSFQYPSFISLKEDYESKNQLSGLPSLNLGLISDKINGTIFVNPSAFGVEGYEQVSTEDIMVGGIKTSLQISDETQEHAGLGQKRQRLLTMPFVSNGNEFFLMFSYDQSGTDQKGLIKQILSTFKFTK